MSIHPVISVIIPTYKRNDLLIRAITSVLSQTQSNFEVIIVDNASDESVIELVEDFSDTRIRLIQDREKSGASFARNIGVSHATSDLIAFLDDDDEYCSTFIEEVCHAFSKNNVDFLWCGTIKKMPNEDDQGFSEEEVVVKNTESLPSDFVLRIGTGCGFCIKKQAFDSVSGFDESYKVSEDRDLVLSLLSKKFKYYFLNKPLHKRYYHRGERLSQSVSALEEAVFTKQLLQKHQAFLLGNERLRLKITDLLAQKYYQGGDLGCAVDTAYGCLKQNAFRIKGLTRFLRYSFLYRLKIITAGFPKCWIRS